MPSSRRLITSTTLSSSAASVTFSGIPSGYKDLVLKCSVRSDSASNAEQFNIVLNGDSSSLYSYTFISGSGSAAASGSGVNTTPGANGYVGAANLTASTFTSIETYIPSYNASQSKPYSAFSAAENNATYGLIRGYAGLYRSNTAISSILLSATGNFVSGSSFYLYGLLDS